MNFVSTKPIYQQITDYLCSLILAGTWEENKRIPSVRDIAAQIEVNPNTVMRSYSFLQENGIIYNKRGIGYFLAENAKQITLKIKQGEFMHNTLPNIFTTLDLLNIPIDKIVELYKKNKN